MKLVKRMDFGCGISESYEGERGTGYISTNAGAYRELKTTYEVGGRIDGKFKVLAKRASYEKAVEMLKEAIG